MRHEDVETRAEADEAEAFAGSVGFTQQTMRRATRPAICTTPTLPWRVSMTRPLRSLSELALSSSALTN
jgi:hypothetical protein